MHGSSFVLGALFLVASGCGPKKEEAHKDPPVPIDCSASATNGCDDWHPATSPFNGKYDSHACVQWRDAPGVNVHAGYADNCKLPPNPQEGTKQDLVASCPQTARAGGCMTATEYSCVVQFQYRDDSLNDSAKTDPAALQAYCESIGAKYVP